MQDYSPAVIASLVSLVIGFALAYGRTRTSKYAFQHRGEAHVSRALLEKFRPPNYHLLNHVTLPTYDGTTQVDHVLISRFGVFVIETKDFSGWIFANQNDSHWTQVLHRLRFRFRNPIHQNFKHLCTIRELIDFVPSGDIIPVVVFSGSAEFKTEIPGGVFYLADFIAYLENRTTEVMSVNRLQFCVGRLEAARLSVTLKTDVEHVERLRQRYGIDE